MPKYSFLAKTLDGKTQVGTKEAENLHQLAKLLKQEGLILIKAEVKKERKKFKFKTFSFGVSLQEKMFFTRNLQVMISAGVSLPRAIASLAEQVKSKSFKKALKKIEEDIIKGTRLSDSLSNFPEIFSDFYQNMIKVAEEAGNLEEVLGVLANYMEREHDLKTKIKGAMIYPAVIVLAMVGVGILMLVVVVPKLAETFKELEIELPLTTKIVIFLGEFLAKKWYLLIFCLFLFFVSLFQFLKTKIGKKILDTISLKVPIVAGMTKKSNTASSARGLASLISAGVSLPRALEITANTLGNSFYKNALIEAAEKVKKGEKLSQCLRNYKNIYPLTFISMIEVGEETGETSNILEKLASFYEEEVSSMAKNLASVVEPILLLIVGAVVGFFVVSMVQPMYSMLQAIK